VSFNRFVASGIAGLRAQRRHSASWPRATSTSTRRSLPRWAACRRRAGHRSQTRGAVLREAAALPRLSACGSRRRDCRSKNRGCFARRAAVDLILPLRREGGAKPTLRLLSKESTVLAGDADNAASPGVAVARSVPDDVLARTIAITSSTSNAQVRHMAGSRPKRAPDQRLPRLLLPQGGNGRGVLSSARSADSLPRLDSDTQLLLALTLKGAPSTG
jgi:hypothetical protein